METKYSCGRPSDEDWEVIIKEDEDHDYSDHPCSQGSSDSDPDRTRLDYDSPQNPAAEYD